MYHDRIEIISPGSLFGANKIGQLGTDVMMESRNPTIVRLLEETSSLIENRHSGIPTMKREMKKMGLPEPEFYELRNCFKVVFRNGKAITPQVTPQVTPPQVTPQVTPQVQIENTTKMKQITPKSYIQKKILEYCVEPRSAKEILDHINYNDIKYLKKGYLIPLMEHGMLERTNDLMRASNQKYVTIKKQ